MDEVDQAILSILQKNSNLPVQRVSELVGSLLFAAKLLGVAPENDLVPIYSAQTDFVSLVNAAFCEFPFDAQSQAGKEQCYSLLATLLLESENDFLRCQEYLACRSEGKRLGLTDEAVRNRINSLKERGIIDAYLPCIDYQKIAPKQITYLPVRMKIGNHESFLGDSRGKEEVREIHSVSGGTVCYLLRIEMSDIATADLFIDEFEHVYAKSHGIRYKVISDVKVATGVIDKKDRAILKVLAKNSQFHLKEVVTLLKEVYEMKLTNNAVSERIKRLEDQKIITGYTIHIHPQHTAPKKIAYVAVVEPIIHYKDFLAFIKCRRWRGEIGEYYRVTGEGASYLFRVQVIDDVTLNSFLKELKRFCDNYRLYNVIASPMSKEGKFD